MKLKITTSAVILGAVATTASAGSLERNNMPIELLFDSGNVVQFSYTAPNLNLSAAPTSTPTSPSTGSVLNDFTTLGLAFKTDINDDLALGVFFNQPFGADNGYEGGFVSGLAIDFQSNELAAVLSYQMNQNLSLHGGLRVVESELNQSIPPASYTLETGSDLGFGYLLGASYVVPERGARVTLTYQSSVKHSFESTEFGSTTFGNTETELPQSLKLDGEIALNSNTLLFGSVKWSDYSNFDVAAPGYMDIVDPVSVIDYNEDNINVSVGLGRSINDEWSGFGILEAQLADGEPNVLRPYDGSRALTLGARYTSGQYEITAGAQYRQFGDATVFGATFSGNDAVSPFLQIAYSF